MAATTQILLEEGYRTTDEALRGWALMTAMSKLEQYRAECELFEKKHGHTLAEFERSAHALRAYPNNQRRRLPRRRSRAWEPALL